MGRIKTIGHSKYHIHREMGIGVSQIFMNRKTKSLKVKREVVEKTDGILKFPNADYLRISTKNQEPMDGRSQKSNTVDCSQSSQHKLSRSGQHAPDCMQLDTKQRRRERSVQDGTWRCVNQHHDNTTGSNRHHDTAIQPIHSTQLLTTQQRASAKETSHGVSGVKEAILARISQTQQPRLASQSERHEQVPTNNSTTRPAPINITTTQPSQPNQHSADDPTTNRSERDQHIDCRS